ncbi:bifunctional 4-hydroxy-2-oxoglutarate aldolase/2-dehydro-3-deoxy-phosphogluconate aldolase [Microbacterium sp. NPDC057407]|uniref:bifunctional 4-hydroxy-2-oxoglutarate aldolase/2-dehydro-3-deoxy-phosphogluconate aldolase n=1 Tax=Microbacterium sp. NPDC057407 TaxID=3346120 RepID=UPI00366F2E73
MNIGLPETSPLIPVVVIDDAADAPAVAAALIRGGIHCAEITLRTAVGLEAIRAVATEIEPGFLVGAGTVLDVDQCDAAVDAGASFVVSPGLDPAIVERARDRGIPVLPGVATATEVQHARRLGLHAVKFFPADRLGGLATVEALAAPFADMGFVPSGGVTAANLGDYLAHPAVPAVSGSWMVARSLIARRDFDRIEALSREAVAIAASAPRVRGDGR